MANYSQYKTETLKKMQDAAFAEYYKAAVKPCGNYQQREEESL